MRDAYAQERAMFRDRLAAARDAGRTYATAIQHARQLHGHADEGIALRALDDFAQDGAAQLNDLLKVVSRELSR